MNEVIFIVEEAAEGGYAARALRESIFAEADDLDPLEADIRDAVRCHFDDEQRAITMRSRREDTHSTHDET